MTAAHFKGCMLRQGGRRLECCSVVTVAPCCLQGVGRNFTAVTLQHSQTHRLLSLLIQCRIVRLQAAVCSTYHHLFPIVKETIMFPFLHFTVLCSEQRREQQHGLRAVLPVLFRVVRVSSPAILQPAKDMILLHFR